MLAPDLKKMVFVSVFFSFAIALFLLNLDKKRKTFDKIQNFDLKKSILLVVVGFFGGDDIHLDCKIQNIIIY